MGLESGFMALGVPEGFFILKSDVGKNVGIKQNGEQFAPRNSL